MKKILSAVIAVLMIATLCCALVGCSSHPTDGLQYTMSSDGQSYEVTGIGTATETAITIASTYESLPVTAIAESAFSENNDIVSVYIPSSIQTIGNSAFTQCQSLTKVTFEKDSQLQMLQYGVFSQCSGLNSITMPQSLNSIESAAFSKCTSLTNITIPDSVTKIGFYAFYDCTALSTVSFGDNSQLEKITELAFGRCTSLASFDINSKVSYVGDNAFMVCTSLKSFDVAEDNGYFTAIDNSLYSADCSVLIKHASGSEEKIFVVAESVTQIDIGAFYGSTNIESITIGSNVELVGYSAFSACTALTSITFPAGTSWYKTLDGFDWLDGCGGTLIETDSDTANATNLTSNNYTNYYLYKG